jgi:hypothetical protein
LTHDPSIRLRVEGIIRDAMDDDSLRLMLVQLAGYILTLDEGQAKIRASVQVLKLALMHMKGIPETGMHEFMDSLADLESKLAFPSPNAAAVQQLRAIIERLESGRDRAALDS